MNEQIAIEAQRETAQKAVRDLRDRVGKLDDGAIDLILRNARSHYAWTDRPVGEETLRAIYEIASAGPTSMNTCPARFVFLTSAADKERLVPALKPANVPKVMTAPVTAIIAWDPAFWEKLDFLFPHEDRKPMFAGKEAHIHNTAFRNSTLQGAYFMIAARALGLDVGPISGFSNAEVDAEFFAESGWKSNFICNLGYADETAIFPKLPRFQFEEVCRVL